MAVVRVVSRKQAKEGAVAQLGERLICIQEVAGSIPTSSTSFELRPARRRQPERIQIAVKSGPGWLSSLARPHAGGQLSAVSFQSKVES